MTDLLTRHTGCLKITRTDTTILAMTELDKDLTIDGQLYNSSISYASTNISNTADLSVNNADSEGYLTLGGLDRDDIVAGLYDGAGIELFIYDYENEVKVRDLGKGSLGEVVLADNRYTAEYRSISEEMQHPIGRIYSAECDARLGDTRCGVTLASFTDSSTVSSVTSSSVFVASSLIGTQSDDYYNYGNLTFTSGDNNGHSAEVKDYNDSTGEITLFLPMPYTVAATDAFDITAGCDKRKTTCINTFSNVENFRGFDFIPGQDSLLKFGGQ